MDDPFALARFVDAQAPVMHEVLAELRAGRKRTHWMWFVFPQLGGLGHSAMARRYAIGSTAEARAYLEHPVLGPRLLEVARALLEVRGRDAGAILGSVDAMKVRSCMTLFHRADPDEPTFRAVLDRYYRGVPDPATDERLGTARV